MVHSKSQISMVLCDFHFHIKFHRAVKTLYFIGILVAAIWTLIWLHPSVNNIDIILFIIGLASGIGYIYSHFRLIYLINNLIIYYKKNRAGEVIDKIRDVHPKIVEYIERITSTETLN